MNATVSMKGVKPDAGVSLEVLLVIGQNYLATTEGHREGDVMFDLPVPVFDALAKGTSFERPQW